MDILGILLIALVGGAVPLFVRWGERGLHTALALSTGIFLGAVFLHFLPTLSTMTLSGEPAPAVATDHAHEAEQVSPPPSDHAEEEHAEEELQHGAHGGDTWLWLFVLIGVLGVYLVEALVLRTHDHDELHRHRSIGWAALLGLTVHALTTGIGYGAARSSAELSGPMLVAILAHKGFESFSLITVFQLAEIERKKVIALVIGFALVTPVSILLGESLSATLGNSGTAILTALAAGTFLYVCLCELLSEVFHHREDSIKKVLLLAAGIALTVLFEWVGHG